MKGIALVVIISTITAEKYSLDLLYHFIENNSPVYSWTYPDADMVGQPKFKSIGGTPHPEIVVVPDTELQSHRLATRSKIEAFYNSDKGTIYISDRIDWGSTYGQSVLLHELVHHVQYQMDLEGIACGYSFVEGDAYSVQAAYLKEHGFDDETLKGVVGASVMYNSIGERCLLELIMTGKEQR